MSWEVEYADEFEVWWNGLEADEQVAIDATVRVVGDRDPNLGRPLVHTITGNNAGEWQGWYVKMIPVADDLHEEHVAELRRGGAI